MIYFRRTKTLPSTVVDQLKKILTDMGADTKDLTQTKQNC